MAAKIYYQEDCNLSLLEGQEDRYYRLRQPGSCTCTELKGVRMRCYHRSLRGQQVLGKGRGTGI